jgi:hypothetical protein
MAHSIVAEDYIRPYELWQWTIYPSTLQRKNNLFRSNGICSDHSTRLEKPASEGNNPTETPSTPAEAHFATPSPAHLSSPRTPASSDCRALRVASSPGPAQHILRGHSRRPVSLPIFPA